MSTIDSNQAMTSYLHPAATRGRGGRSGGVPKLIYPGYRVIYLHHLPNFRSPPLAIGDGVLEQAFKDYFLPPKVDHVADGFYRRSAGFYHDARGFSEHDDGDDDYDTGLAEVVPQHVYRCLCKLSLNCLEADCFDRLSAAAKEVIGRTKRWIMSGEKPHRQSSTQSSQTRSQARSEESFSKKLPPILVVSDRIDVLKAGVNIALFEGGRYDGPRLIGYLAFAYLQILFVLPGAGKSADYGGLNQHNMREFLLGTWLGQAGTDAGCPVFLPDFHDDHKVQVVRLG